jgi:predicted transposase YdaD
MHEYDVTLKLILQRLTALMTRELTGVTITRWLNVEVPEMQNTRVDLLGETGDGSLIHIEFQSHNDNTMALRMLEYCVRVFRLHGQFPRQILLYVGEAPLRMKSALAGGRVTFSYEQTDIRDLDCEPLLASDQVSDNVIAILTRLGGQPDAVRRILIRIAGLEPAEREGAFKQLLVLAGLRRLEEFVAEEARKMPILNDIMDHRVIGPAIRKGRKEGRKEGREEGREEGAKQGALTVVHRIMRERFGAVPDWAAERLASKTATELEDLSVRLLGAHDIEELLR